MTMQDDIAIRVENLSKRFRLGLEEEQEDNLAQTILNSISRPIKNYRKYKSLYKFQDSDGGADMGGDAIKGDVLWALRDINFEVPRGQVMGIIGANGAGKSTLLKVLSQITPPTSGRISISGRVSSLLEVGTGFHQELTGRENVYLNGSIMGMTKVEIDRKFDEIVDFSGVEQFLDTPVKRYSSGMRLRLAFAVAAHLEPEVLIIDEVLAVGDAAFQRKSLNKMEDVSQQGRTVLFVSHNMAAVTRLCSRAIMLQGGRMVKDDTAANVVAHYLSGEQGIRGVRDWSDGNGPGDNVARLLRLRVKGSNGRSLAEAQIDEPVGLEMEYYVQQGGRVLMPHFIVWDDSGGRVFTAMETDPAWMGKRRPAGTYTTTAWIPGNLLSEGMHYISAQMKSIDPFERHFHARQEIAFHVLDSEGGDTARGAWTGSIDGAVRPKLDWESTYTEQLAASG